MKMKSQFAFAGLLFAALLASGCSQQQAAGSQQTSSAQQATEAPVETAPAPVQAAPAPAPAPVRVQPAPVVPKVKAKGNYKGAVQMDPASAAAMDAYRQ